MSITESLYFSYAGEKSIDYGIINVSKGDGMQEEIFLPSREIKEIQVRGRKRPYFQEVSYSPLSIPLRFAFEETWNEEKIRSVARWLMQDYYKELYFSDNINRRFYAIYEGDAMLLHNMLKQGWVEITMRNIDCYSYSPVYTENFDLSLNSSSGTLIELKNYGDEIVSPLITVKLVSGTGFSIQNLNNSGQTMEFIDLAEGEILTIDCENEEITTDIPLTYRYDNHNAVFLECLRGYNRLLVKGNVKLNFKWQCKTFQG